MSVTIQQTESGCDGEDYITFVLSDASIEGDALHLIMHCDKGEDISCMYLDIKTGS